MSNPAPTTDIAALIEAGAESMYGKNWNGPPDKRPGEEMKNVWRGYTRDALKPALTILVAQQAEIERLRARLECDGTNMADERVSVEPYDGIAVRDVLVADLRADLGWIYLTHGHFRHARSAINSTEPSDDR